MWNNALYIYVLWMNLKIEMLIFGYAVSNIILSSYYYFITLH